MKRVIPGTGRDGSGEVITSRANARVKQLRAASTGNTRASSGLVAIEGEILIQEALRSGVALRTVFLEEGREAPAGLPEDVEVLRCNSDVLASAVETKSPQGIAALITPPLWTLEELLGRAEAETREEAPLFLIAVGLQDPGNLGTLVRSAEAFGADGVLLTAGTVDPWNSKALRASAGSAFRLPIVRVTEEEIRGLHTRGIRLLASVSAHDHAVGASMAGMAGACAVMIGNEGSGLAEHWLAAADSLVTIPCPGPVESLNAAVAGSLLLYEASRQRGAR